MAQRTRKRGRERASDETRSDRSRSSNGDRADPVERLHQRLGNRAISRQIQRQTTGGYGAAGYPFTSFATGESERTDEEVTVAAAGEGGHAAVGEQQSVGVVFFPSGEAEVGDSADAVEQTLGPEIVSKIRFYQRSHGDQTARIVVTGSASGEWESESDLIRQAQLNADLARRRARAVADVLRSYLSTQGIAEDAYTIALDAEVGSRDPVRRSDRHAEVSLVAQSVPLYERPEREEEPDDGPYDDHLLNIAVNNVGYMMIAEQLVDAVAAALPGVAGTAGAGRKAKLVEQLLKVDDMDDHFGDLSTTEKETLRTVRERTRLEYERLLELNPSYKPGYCRHYPDRDVCN